MYITPQKFRGEVTPVKPVYKAIYRGNDNIFKTVSRGPFFLALAFFAGSLLRPRQTP